MLLLSPLLLLVAGVTAAACFTASRCCWHSSNYSLASLLFLMFPGLPAIAGIPALVGVHAVAFVPAIAGFSAVAGALAIASVRVDLGVLIFSWCLDILHCVQWDVLDYRTIRPWLSDWYFFCYSTIGILNIGLATSRNYQTSGYWIKVSIYQTIEYLTLKKLSFAKHSNLVKTRILPLILAPQY